MAALRPARTAAAASPYVAGKLQTGILCVGLAWSGAGHALVNGVEAIDHYSGHDYPEAADGCIGGTASGRYTFANGPDGFDYVDTYEYCPAAGRPDQYTGEIWSVLTMGYDHYLGASGHGFSTFTLSVVPQKQPTLPPLTATATSKETFTLILAR